MSPDHADTKNVTHQFDRTLGDGRVRFWGGVGVAERESGGGAPPPASASASPALSVPDLRRLYSAVVLAHGAEGDARLGGVPGGARGEAAAPTTATPLSPPPLPPPPLRNVLSARDFVLWVNGHPDRAGLVLDLSQVCVCVCEKREEGRRGGRSTRFLLSIPHPPRFSFPVSRLLSLSPPT